MKTWSCPSWQNVTFIALVLFAPQLILGQTPADKRAEERLKQQMQEKAQGTWKVVYETGAGGIEIPEELKPRDNRIRLGTLFGTIVQSPKELEDAKPFLIEDGQDFIAKTSGQLFLRMFDIDPSDNEGKLMVLIQSTFGN